LCAMAIKNKDKNAPKKNLSSYMLFSNDKRPEMAKDPKYAGVKGLNPDLMKDIAELWKNLPAAQKEPYERKAKEEKERFDREFKEYKEKHGDALAAHRAKLAAARKKKAEAGKSSNPMKAKGPGSQLMKKKVRDLEKQYDAPTGKAKTCFMLFGDEVRPGLIKENPGVKVDIIAGLIGKAWAAADAATKERLNKEAEKSKKEFDAKVAAFKSSDKFQKFTDAKKKIVDDFLEERAKKKAGPKKKKKKGAKKPKATKGKGKKKADDSDDDDDSDDSDESEKPKKKVKKPPVKKDIKKKDKKDKKSKKDKKEKKEKKKKKDKKEKKKKKKKDDSSDSDSD